MKKKEIKNKYNNIINDLIPNVLDNVLENFDNLKGDDIVMKKENKYECNWMFKYRYVISACALCLICLCGIFGYNMNNIDSVIALDVNPSIVIKTNNYGKVKSINSLNEDGNKVIDNLKLKNKNIEDSINEVVDSMIKNGYINENKNSILISVDNKDNIKREELKSSITNEIDKKLKDNNIDGAVLSQVLDKEDDKDSISIANEKNISVGKAKLILDILDEGLRNNNNQLITFEELEKLSINELNVIAKTKKIDFNNISSKGEPSTKIYIGEDNAKSIALKNGNVSNYANLKVNFDFEKGKFIYEVEFLVGNIEYEYEIDAKTGEILDIDKDVKKNKKNDKKDNDDIVYDSYDSEKVVEIKKEYESKIKELEVKDDEIDKSEDQIEDEIKKLEAEERELKNKIRNANDDEKLILKNMLEVNKIKKEELELKEDKIEAEEKKIENEIKRLKEELKAK